MMVPAHFPLDRLAAALRADGIACVIRPGAQGKSARRFASVGYYVGCQAIVQHHTVSSGTNPDNDLAFIDGGKGDGYIISNAYTALDGTVTLIASGPTYTEGSGGPYGIIPAGRANDVAFSNEIASWGAPLTEYPQAQQDAVAALTYHAAVIAADVWNWPDDPFGPHRAFAHFEWAPDRKVDPRGVSRWSPNGGMWDMDAFRSELATRHTDPQEDDMEVIRVQGDTAQYVTQGRLAYWIPDGETKTEWVDIFRFDPAVNEVPRSRLAHHVLVGPQPQYQTMPASPTNAGDFGGHIA